MMDARNPHVDTPHAEADEISLGDLLRAGWAARAWAAGGLVLGAIVAIASTFLVYFSEPGLTSYRQDVGFTLQDQAKSQYPNGTAFSPNDLRSPVVLQRVYDEFDFAGYGLSYLDFAAAVTVTPSSALYEGIIERYRERLSERTLTFEERRQIESEFSSAIGATLSSNAVVSLTLPNHYKVPQVLGQQAVASIPNVWADIYINQLGVIDFPVPSATGELISPEFIDALDYPIAYDALVTAFSELRERIETIAQLSGSRNLAEPVTGRTLFDIEREVNRLQQFSLNHVLAPLTELGLNKSPELTIAAYQYQIEDIDRQIRLAQDNARILDAVLRNADRDQANMLPPAVGDTGSASAVVPNTIVQQFGPELVDRLIGMSVENAGIAFRERMLEEKWQYESEGLHYAVQRDQYAQRLALIRGERPLENAERLASIFSSESQMLVAELNLLWSQVDGLLSQANLQRLNYDKQLFRPLPTLNAVQSSAGLLSRDTFVIWVAAGFGGLIAGMIFFFLRRVMRR